MKLRLPIQLAALLLAALGAVTAGAADSHDPFRVPDGFEERVTFWTRVYLDADSDGGFIHDSRLPGAVYEKITLRRPDSRRATRRQLDARRRHWKQVLEKLASGGEPRTEDARTARAALTHALGREPTAREIRASSRRLRFQRGQRDRFRKGLIRAGAYEDRMRDIFVRAGLPGDLSLLPHVESSFNTKAYSKYGAAGVWQFMRATGRRYMEVNYVVDERLDPYEATRAATRLLRDNYALLGSWPLAITAYNHGAAGMRRAKRQLGTDDIVTVVERYRGRTFGFASQNFYAQFLAARRIALDHERHFGKLARHHPRSVERVTLPFYLDVADAETHLGLGRRTIARHNPALRPSVMRGDKRIPRGYVLQLPPGTVSGSPDGWLAGVPEAQRHDEQRRSHFHRVSRGETLSGIAKLHGTSVSTIVALNDLRSRHRIYPGQVLELMSPDGSAPPAKVAIAAAPVPVASPTPATAVPVAATLVTAVEPPVPETVSGAGAQPAAEAEPAIGEDAPSLAVALPFPREARWRYLDGETIQVDINETLGHFADWLDVSARRLRQINGLSRRRHLRMGQELTLDFSKVTVDTFLERRIEYHKGIEEDFFDNFRITGTVDHTLREGENLWVLSHKVYAVPAWLIYRYNPDDNMRRLAPGTRITIPIIEAQGTTSLPAAGQTAGPAGDPTDPASGLLPAT